MRIALLLIVVGLGTVFTIAVRLDPYEEDGTPRRMETHTQLGLPPCTFYKVTGMPCPACGMTTSFALLAHGDIGGSLQAHPIGTLLALFCLALIPWIVLCAVRGRLYLIRSVERSLTWLLFIFLVLLLGRWGIVLWLR
jgi:hypothetical protein